jgi:hypothetical protein
MKKTDAVLHSRWFFPVLLALSLAMPGCDKEVEPVPAYLHIEPFKITATNPEVHGSISEKITHAKVFLLDKTTGESHSLGVVTLPATIPSLATGEQEIIIDPIIKANGNTLFLEIYPFYNRFKQNINLVSNEELTVSPVTSYVDNAKFEFVEDFEGPGHLFEVDRDNNPGTKIELSKDDIFEGEYSGKITLDSANNVIVAASNFVYTLLYSDVGKVFMEVNYKTDVVLEFGVLNIDATGNEFPNFEFVVLAKPEWNKIYFDMTDIIATASHNRFVFVMRAGLPFENGKPTLEKAEIYLDNIKLIHF